MLIEVASKVQRKDRIDRHRTIQIGDGSCLSISCLRKRRTLSGKRWGGASRELERGWLFRDGSRG
jgi:hypothetical protein